jgi:hypothetical protein
MRYAAALCVVLGWGGAAHGGAFVATPLFVGRDWRVDEVRDVADGSGWCAADTWNARGQALSVVAFGAGSLALVFAEPGWAAPRAPRRYVLEIDGRRWDAPGAGVAETLSLSLVEPAVAWAVAAALGAGGTVALRDGRDRPLAAFPLAGARDAVAALGACRARLGGARRAG